MRYCDSIFKYIPPSWFTLIHNPSLSKVLFALMISHLSNRLLWFTFVFSNPNEAVLWITAYSSPHGHSPVIFYATYILYWREADKTKLIASAFMFYDNQFSLIVSKSLIILFTRGEQCFWQLNSYLGLNFMKKICMPI